MPQPLSSLYHYGLVHIANSGTNVFDQRPMLATEAMNVVASWAHMEATLERTFVYMLGANPGPAAAIYSALFLRFHWQQQPQRLRRQWRRPMSCA